MRRSPTALTATFAIALAASPLASGCVATQLSSEEGLRDAIYEYNDAVRWGRVGSALSHVATAARRRIARRQLAWMRLVRIADSSLVDVTQDARHRRATVLVSLSWYRDDDPYVRTTVLEQTWRDQSDGWRMTDEFVADGDESLLALGTRGGESERQQRD